MAKSKRIAGLAVPAGYEPPDAPGIPHPLAKAPLPVPPGTPLAQSLRLPWDDSLIEVLYTYRCRGCGFLSPMHPIIQDHVAECRARR